jgi:hypothetical protein
MSPQSARGTFGFVNSPLGDPDHRVVWRGDRFVFWGFATYASVQPGKRLKRIADVTWFFIPSAQRDRVWVTVLDPGAPQPSMR